MLQLSQIQVSLWSSRFKCPHRLQTMIGPKVEALGAALLPLVLLHFILLLIKKHLNMTEMNFKMNFPLKNLPSMLQSAITVMWWRINSLEGSQTWTSSIMTMKGMLWASRNSFTDVRLELGTRMSTGSSVETGWSQKSSWKQEVKERLQTQNNHTCCHGNRNIWVDYVAQ